MQMYLLQESKIKKWELSLSASQTEFNEGENFMFGGI